MLILKMQCQWRIYLFALLVTVFTKGASSQCTTGNLLGISDCATTYGNHTADLAVKIGKQEMSLAQACSQIETIFMTAKNCFAQYKPNCGDSQMYAQAISALDEGRTMTRKVLNCSGTGGTDIDTTCPLTIQAAIGQCVITFTNGLTEATTALTSDINVSTFCSTLTNLISTAKTCMTTAAAGNGDCNTYIGLQQNALDMNAKEIQKSCGGGSSNICSVTVQTTLLECVNNFTTAFTSISQTMAQGIDVFCSAANDAITKLNTCMAKAAGSDASCATVVQLTQQQLKTMTSQFDLTCSSCSVTRASSCFSGFSGVGNNMTALCKMLNDGFACLDAKKLECPTLTLDKIFGKETMESFDMQRKMCTPECGNIIEKSTKMQQCITTVSSPQTFTFTSVCSQIESLTKCIVSGIGTCGYLVDMIAGQLPDILQTVSMFGCDITIDSHTYKPTGCSLRKLVECYNPYFQAFGEQPITGNTDIKALFNTVTSSGSFSPTPTNVSVACSMIKDVDKQAVRKCVVDEYLKCPINFLQQEQTPLGMWRNTSVMSNTPKPPNMMPPSDDGFNLTSYLNMGDISAASLLFNNLDRIDYKLARSCASGCENVTEREQGLTMCATSVNVTENFDNITMGIISKYKNNMDYTADCGKLSAIAMCISKYAAGCAETEVKVTKMIGDSYFYSVFSICKVTLDFPLTNLPGECPNKDFQVRQMDLVYKACAKSHLMASDNIGSMTKTDICNALQQQVICYARNTPCCATRNQVLKPMMQTWGMINQLMQCDLKLRLQYDPKRHGLTGDGIPIKPMAMSTGGACNYNDVIMCYKPLLMKVDINLMAETTITPQMLNKILSLSKMLAMNTGMCPTMSEMTTIEQCVNQQIKKCKYPATCDQNMDNSTPKMDTLGMLPLAKMLDLVKIKSICSQECKDSSFTNTTFTDCNVNVFNEESGNVVWNSVVGGDNNKFCSDIKKVSDCVNLKVGKCEYQIMKVHDKLGLNQGINMDAAKQCGVTIGQQQQTTQAPATTTTTTKVTTGAQNVKPTAVVVVMVSLLLMFTI